MSVLVDADLQFITSGAMNSIVPWNDDDNNETDDDDDNDDTDDENDIDDDNDDTDDENDIDDDDDDKIPQACSTQCYLPRRPLRLAQSQWSWCRPFAAIINIIICRCWEVFCQYPARW